jgi:hypothetical protein
MVVAVVLLVVLQLITAEVVAVPVEPEFLLEL